MIQDDFSARFRQAAWPAPSAGLTTRILAALEDSAAPAVPWSLLGLRRMSLRAPVFASFLLGVGFFAGMVAGSVRMDGAAGSALYYGGAGVLMASSLFG